MATTTEGLLSRRCSTYSEMFMLQGLSCSYREELRDHWFVVQTCSKCRFCFSKFGSHSVSHRFSFLTFGLVTISHHIPSRPASASQINARCLGDADGSWAPSKDEGLQDITRAYWNVHRQSMFVYLCYFIHLDYFDYLCYVIIPVVEQVLAGFCWTCWQYIIRISSGNCEIVTFGIPWVDSIKHSIRHWWMPVIKLRQGKGNKDKHFMTAAKLQALACLIEPVVLWLPWLNDLPSERWLLCRSQCANFDLNPELIVALLWLVLEVFARQSQGSC